VKTIEEIRHANLAALIARYPTLRAFSDDVGLDPAQVGQWRNKNKRPNGTIYRLDSSSARAIEQKLHLPSGWLDNDPEAWPLDLVSQQSYLELTETERAYVQGAMAAAIKERVAAREGPTATHIHTGHGGRDSAHHLHDSGKRYGT
jgi:hypothetical protein